MAGQWAENEHCKKQRKRKRERADGEDRVKHLIHRKWTEPHKASFLCELAAVGGAAVEKALLIWIKQGLFFNIPLLWVSQVSRPKPFFFSWEISICSVPLHSSLNSSGKDPQLFCSVAQLGRPGKWKRCLHYWPMKVILRLCEWALRPEIWQLFSYGELDIVPRLHFSVTDVTETTADYRTGFTFSTRLSESWGWSEDVRTDTHCLNPHKRGTARNINMGHTKPFFSEHPSKQDCGTLDFRYEWSL